MLTIRGKVQNGAVTPLEPISDSYEGREVTITLPDETEAKKKEGIREMFGTWNSSNPHSSDNEQIDADLARAYADTHDDE